MGTSYSIVFIHGLHENTESWELWKKYFKSLGYTCYSPSYPYHDGIPKELRQKPNPLLATINLKDVITHYKNFIDDLGGDLPILVGHSMGGLIVQKLIQQEKGLAGICIGSAAPKGVLSFKWSYLKSNIGVVNPLKGNQLYCGSKSWFHYAICNTLSRALSDEIYEKAVVPESRNIPRSSRGKQGYIDFNKPHKPLLFVAAEKDHIIPVSLNAKNASSYKDKQSIVDFKVFKNRSHAICIENNWEEVAQFVQDWLSTKIN